MPFDALPGPAVTVEPTCEVYSHTCPDGLTYIGFTTTTMERRFEGHCRDAANGSHLEFHDAIRRVGEDGFRSRVLFVGPESEARAKEIELIASMGTMVPGGYNVSEGGSGGNMGPAWQARSAAATRETQGDSPAAPATAAACLHHFKTYPTQGVNLNAALTDAALRWPDIPAWQFKELAREAGLSDKSALAGRTAVAPVVTLLSATHLAAEQTVAAALAAWPGVLAQAEASKATQMEGGKKLKGSSKGATTQALRILSIVFFAVPAWQLARALGMAQPGEIKRPRIIAIRAAVLGVLPAGMCPALRAALGDFGDFRNPAARAAQAAAIAAARTPAVWFDAAGRRRTA